jgi:hypothetical protein
MKQLTRTLLALLLSFGAMTPAVAVVAPPIYGELVVSHAAPTLAIMPLDLVAVQQVIEPVSS